MPLFLSFLPGLSPILLVVLPMPQLKTSVIFKPTRELVCCVVVDHIDFSTVHLFFLCCIFAGIYAGLVGSSTLLAFTRAILFFYICIRAAKKLHNITFSAVLRMPTRFFDINPIGMYAQDIHVQYMYVHYMHVHSMYVCVYTIYIITVKPP